MNSLMMDINIGDCKQIMGYENIKFDKNTKFLVTGGAGFIGSNLCETLLKLGYNVRCLDNFSTGKKENIEEFLGNPNFEFIFGDIQNLDTCIKATKDIDFVLHEAALGSVPRSINEPLLYCQNNINGMVNMLEAARQNKVKKFIYASSSSVYGDEIHLPKQEGREGNLLSPYALSKRTCEEWAKQYYKHYGLATIGLRYFNVFGPKQNPLGPYAAVIPKFILELKANKIPTINGDGKQSRDFTYVENVIEANLKACLAKEDAFGEVFNIANNERSYLIDVYNTLAKALNCNVQPNFGPDRAGDIKHSFADISKANKLLGYCPSWTFEQGIKKTIDWYNKKSV